MVQFLMPLLHLSSDFLFIFPFLAYCNYVSVSALIIGKKISLKMRLFLPFCYEFYFFDLLFFHFRTRCGMTTSMYFIIIANVKMLKDVS